MSTIINNTWIVQRILGSGAFSDAYLCQHKDTGKEAVAKVTEFADKDVTKVKKYVDAEIQALTRLRGHTNFVQLYEVIEEAECTILMLEYIDGIELFDLLQQQDEGYVPAEIVQDIASQLLVAIKFMHSQGVLWRDLKLDNIMVDREGIVKCLDFNLATTFTVDQELKDACGTPQYASPFVLFAGVFRTTYQAHECVDLWSLGVSLYGLSTGHFPFRSSNARDLLDEVRELSHGKRQLEFPSHLPLELVDFLKTLLRPGKRITLESTTSHAWVKNTFAPWQKPRRSVSVDSVNTLVNATSEEL